MLVKCIPKDTRCWLQSLMLPVILGLAAFLIYRAIDPDFPLWLTYVIPYITIVCLMFVFLCAMPGLVSIFFWLASALLSIMALHSTDPAEIIAFGVIGYVSCLSVWITGSIRIKISIPIFLFTLLVAVAVVFWALSVQEQALYALAVLLVIFCTLEMFYGLKKPKKLEAPPG